MFSSFGEKSMDRLEENIGKTVKIDFVVMRFPISLLGKIQEVKRFRFIEIEKINLVGPLDPGLARLVKKESLKIPFVWPGSAIQVIENKDILYEMCLIDDNYSQINPVKVLELAKLIYGPKVAKDLIELRQIIEDNDKNIFNIFFI